MVYVYIFEAPKTYSSPHQDWSRFFGHYLQGEAKLFTVFSVFIRTICIHACIFIYTQTTYLYFTHWATAEETCQVRQALHTCTYNMHSILFQVSTMCTPLRFLGVFFIAKCDVTAKDLHWFLSKCSSHEEIVEKCLICCKNLKIV